MKKRPIFLTLLAVIALVALALLARSFAPASVKTAHPTQGPAVEAVYATGTVEATVMMPIAARSSARLMELNVDEGTNVTKGQVLARLEDEDLQDSVRELEAKTRVAQDAFDRAAVLFKQGHVSREARDRAESELKAAEATVGRARTQLDFMKLIAPADGRIIRRDGEIGQMIPSNQPVFWMSCCAPLRITSEVDEEDIARVQPGQKALIRADAFPGQTFEGTVQSITPKGDPVARSYRVRIGFGGDVPLLIGMTAETNLIIHETDKAILVPTSAVMRDSVWLVKDGKLVKQPVKLGAKGADQIEIREGVTMEDKVVVNPSATLEEGARVQAR